MPTLKRPSTAAGRGCLVGFGLIWTGFSLFWMLGAWQTGAPIAFVLFGTPFVLVGLGLMGFALKSSIAGIKVGTPEINVSHDSLALGQEFSLSYRQTMKRPVDVTRIGIKFLLRESATYRRGTDNVTVHHEKIFQEFEIPGRHYESGEVVTGDYALRVPADGMHTFQAQHNKILWILSLKVEIPGWPDYSDEYEVTVLPEGMG